MKIVNPLKAIPVALVFSLPVIADDAVDLPDAPNLVLSTVGAHPTFNARNDGFGGNSDVLDATFLIDVDFIDKIEGQRETIFETGAATIGTSFVYEAPNTLVVRSVGNGGLALVTASYVLPQPVIDGGEVEVGFTIDVDDGNGLQALSIVVDGGVVETQAGTTGGDWSGGDGARVGAAGGVTGNGANGTLPSSAFTSGTLNLANGLRFYANTRWIPVGNDSDNDGLPDWWEQIYTPGDLDELTTGGDADGDGLTDDAEFTAETNPMLNDTDEDGLTDGIEANPAEIGYLGTNPLKADSDGDGRSDGAEVNDVPTSDPLDRDSDDDGVVDGIEVLQGTDPNDAASRSDLGEFLVAYYSLDRLGAGLEAPDAFGFHHLTGSNLDQAAVVTGKNGNAIVFDATKKTMLARTSGGDDSLPVSKHPEHSIVMWVNVKGTGQNNLSLFSEGSLTENTSRYNLGTHNTGADDSLDLYLRAADGSSPNHQYSTSTPLDGTWHHIAWVVAGEQATLYVDGVVDASDFTWVDLYSPSVNATSLGGIQRSLKSEWMTGKIDEVSFWNLALTATDVAALASSDNALAVIDDLDRDGLPDAWERKFGLDPSNAGDAALDDDNDDLSNLQEFVAGTNPTLQDTDGDGLNDGVETDDGVWVSAAATGTSPRSVDTDRDGLDDAVEVPNLAFDPDNPFGQPGSDPSLFDTDGDGISDGSEVLANSNPEDAGSSPVAEALGIWLADDEALGTEFGGDGWAMGSEEAPAGAILDPINAPEVVEISAAGAAQTGLTQAVDFTANAQFGVAAEPNSLFELFGSTTITGDATIEMIFSPDSDFGGHQYLWESGGTGDGQGIVIVDTMLYLGVNDSNGAPYGGAVVGVDLAPLYGPSGFSPDDYLVLRAVFQSGKKVTLGVTHLGTGLSGVASDEWSGNSWDGGDIMGMGRWSGGRGGDRNQQLSTLPGATTAWPGFEGQIAKFSLFAVPLPATNSSVTTDTLEITNIIYDGDSDRITLTWNTKSGKVYGVYASPDGQDWATEIDDSVTSDGDTATFTFGNPTPGLERQFFRVVEF
ncbi:hypothetical protein OAG31_00470 [Akkermansiaceae bacterium]|nr:hypothetical protein [Akkermansiaceae bacterium]